MCNSNTLRCRELLSFPDFCHTSIEGVTGGALEWDSARAEFAGNPSTAAPCELRDLQPVPFKSFKSTEHVKIFPSS